MNLLLVQDLEFATFMSAYQNSKVDKKMANMKEKITLSRNRSKRPDKQLYVPRALRKSDMENTMDKEDVSANKVPVKFSVVPEVQKVENNSTLLNQVPDSVKYPNMNNSDADETLKIIKNKMPLVRVKNSNEKETTSCASDRDSNLFLDDHEQYIRDIDQSHNTLKFDTDLNESTNSSEIKSIISSDKMDLEDVGILTNNAEPAELKNEELQCSAENFCNQVNVLKVEDDPSLNNQSKDSSKKNSNISSIKMNLEDVIISTNNVIKTELNNEVLHNSNENYCNSITVKVKVEDDDPSLKNQSTKSYENNPNISSIKMNLEDVVTSTNHAIKTELNEVLQNSNENYCNPVTVKVKDSTSLKNQSIKSNKKNSITSSIETNLEDVDMSTNNERKTEFNNEVLKNSNENFCNSLNAVKVEDKPSSENPEDSWETKFNDDGDCLDPKFIKELCDVTGQIHLAVAKSDYSDYQPSLKNTAEEFENIVELYGFPVEFSTQDLTMAFSSFQEASYNIKWVDDTHALVIFSSPAIASQALHLSHPYIKVRPVSEGIKESKEKARFCARMYETYKPRPVTSAVLARRLVSGALGLKVKTSKEQRDTERNILKEAKEKKKLKARQQQDIWNGIVS